MTIQNINIGNIANDGTGDTLRDAAQKINDNFTYLWSEVWDNADSGASSNILDASPSGGATDDF